MACSKSGTGSETPVIRKALTCEKFVFVAIACLSYDGTSTVSGQHWFWMQSCPLDKRKGGQVGHSAVTRVCLSNLIWFLFTLLDKTGYYFTN